LLLDLISLLKRLEQLDIDRGVRFLLNCCKEEDKKQIHSSFLEYRAQGSVFGSSYPAALHYDNPIMFWKSYLFDKKHSLLAKLSIRIFEAISNSIASERAFSCMNLIHTKLRNRLGSEKANKLIYIYMNQRVLDRNKSLFIGDPIEKTIEEQIELEEVLLEILGSDDSSED